MSPPTPLRALASRQETSFCVSFPTRRSSRPHEPLRPARAPRLHETLRLLAEGSSTEAIATTLGVTRESARNYIRLLLRALGAHSRLEAVARGRELRLLEA